MPGTRRVSWHTKHLAKPQIQLDILLTFGSRWKDAYEIRSKRSFARVILVSLVYRYN